MKPYQGAILAGSLLALVQAAARYKRWDAPMEILETSSFLFCAAGVIEGGRTLRRKFRALDFDKKTASRGLSFMREHREIQIWSTLATASMFSILAIRMDWSPLIALAFLLLILLAVPIINRSTGWSKEQRF